MRLTKVSAVSVVLAALTTTTVAFAFSRNLSGSWSTSKGTRIVVLHDTGTSEASFSTAAPSNAWGLTSIVYKGFVLGEDGSTEFLFDGHADDVAVREGSTTCTISAQELLAEGQVLGQFPSRSLQMRRCVSTRTFQCVNDDGSSSPPKTIAGECTGIWR